jgi:regulator of sigma E protease
MGVIYFILVLSVIIVIHECGHLLAAKAFGVYCYEFSLGMGPKIFSFQKKETKYTLRLIPIGGYVAMAGEQEDDMELYPDINVPKNRSIKGISYWKRIVIMIAGVVMNFVLCWVIISGILIQNGEYALSPKPIVNTIVENSPAASAGFETGDLIKKVVFADGTVIKPKEFTDLSTFTISYGDEMTYTVERDGQLIDIKVKGQATEDGIYMVGIGAPASEVVKINLLNAGKYGFDYMVDMTGSIFKSLTRLVQGNGLDQLSGPVGIYQVTAQQASLGLSNLLLLIALLSLNVGIFNLLPLPVLDGGRIILTLVEMIIGKPLNKKFELGIMTASMVLLFGLMIFATWQDIVRIFN